MTESVSLLGFLRDYPGPCVLSAVVNDIASVVIKTERELIWHERKPLPPVILNAVKNLVATKTRLFALLRVTNLGKHS